MFRFVSLLLLTCMLALAQNPVERVVLCTDAGATDAYSCTPSPALAAYTTGLRVRLIANTANTDGATVAISGLVAKAIVKVAGGITTALSTNDIRAGQFVDLVYDGTNFQMLSQLGNAATGGGGASTAYINMPGGHCQLGAAGTGFILPATLYPSPGCAAGSNTLVGYLEWPDADGDYSAQAMITLSGTISSIDVYGKWRTSDTTTSNAVVIQLQTACFANGESVDPAWNTAQTITDNALGTALAANDFSLTGLTLTGCASGETLMLRILRNRTHASDTISGTFQLLSLGLTINR